MIDFFQRAERLSVIFGDIATVQDAGENRQRWIFTHDGGGPAWDCVVTAEDDERLRFVDVNPQRRAGIVLEFRDAPQDRGTEVIAHVTSPAPGTLSGALTYKALYRARALIQTAEVPTIRHNPSARHSAR